MVRNTINYHLLERRYAQSLKPRTSRSKSAASNIIHENQRQYQAKSSNDARRYCFESRKIEKKISAVIKKQNNITKKNQNKTVFVYVASMLTKPLTLPVLVIGFHFLVADWLETDFPTRMSNVGKNLHTFHYQCVLGCHCVGPIHTLRRTA